MTNEDLGASIDGTEELVQDQAGSMDPTQSNSHNVNAEASAELPTAPLSPVLTEDDDHRDDFYGASDEKLAQEKRVVHPMLADADPLFEKQQEAEGVQA